MTEDIVDDCGHCQVSSTRASAKCLEAVPHESVLMNTGGTMVVRRSKVVTDTWCSVLQVFAPKSATAHAQHGLQPSDYKTMLKLREARLLKL